MSEQRGPQPPLVPAGDPDLPAWAAAASLFDWACPPSSLWEPGPRQGRWFVGGRLSLAANLLDRHARRDPEAVALAWEGEPGDARTLTYAALLEEVLALTRALRGLGVTAGDLIALHLGANPETVVAMLACARLGASYTVIPIPLPVDGLVDRLAGMVPRVLFTQDGAWRQGMVLPLKARADDALSAVVGIEHTIVVRRTGMDVGWYEGDRWYHDLVATARPGNRVVAQPQPEADPEAFPTDQPLLVATLPRRAGRPAAAVLGPASIISAAGMHRSFTDGRVVWCAGDISWPGMQIHGVLGPLALGHTCVLTEGTLDVPEPTRAWATLARHEVTTFISIPSVLRRMRTWVHDIVELPPVPALRRVVTLGEPLDADLRAWVAARLAGRPIDTADGWGQMELGGMVVLDSLLEPSFAPDVGLRIVDEAGVPVPDGRSGELVLTRPWAGALLAGSSPDVLAAHWRQGAGTYLTGDRARRLADGSVEYLGRIDRVVSVSGQLVSLGEVQALLLEHPYVRAVDVIERPGPDGAPGIAAAVVLADGVRAGESARAGADLAAIGRELNLSVREVLGGLACPRVILVLDRCGDELRGDERRRALARVQLPVGASTARVSWAQVVAAAEPPSTGP